MCGLSTSSVESLVSNLLVGWKKKRIKRALKQLRRNKVELHGKTNGGLQAMVNGSSVWDWESQDEPHDIGTSAVKIENGSADLKDYTGDLTSFIKGFYGMETKLKNLKVGDLIDDVSDKGNNTAADAIIAAMVQLEGVTRSCKVTAFLEMLDKPRQESARN